MTSHLSFIFTLAALFLSFPSHAAKEPACPSVKDFKKIISAKHNNKDPFQPVQGPKERRWIVLQRPKKKKKEDLEILVIEQEAKETKLPETHQTTLTCHYLFKNKDQVIDRSKIVEEKKK